MSSRLIVRNIPKYITENQLKECFAKFGKVTDVKILFKGIVNRRFCFVGTSFVDDRLQRPRICRESQEVLPQHLHRH